jgi:hypothetical protein
MTMTDTCILVNCSQPVTVGMGSVTLRDGSQIHLECMFDWQRNGGELRPKEDSDAQDPTLPHL